MAAYVIRRVLTAFLLVVLVSILSFLVMEAPPGDFATTYVSRLVMQDANPERTEALLTLIRNRYGLDKPIFIRYFKWIGNIITKGDFGLSFSWNKPVSALLRERLPITLLIGVGTLVFLYVAAVPIGIFTAVRQNRFSDYFFTFASFVGISIPSFLLALVLIVIAFLYLDFPIGGLFSPEFQDAPFSFAKLIDLIKHLLVPIIVLGVSSTAATVRVLRAAMLDELGKDYMRVARAKGLSEIRIIMKYPLRLALNPVIAAAGWQLPYIISGTVIVSLVANIPDVGPLLYRALLSQDMYLAGAIVFLLSTLTIFGTLLSDILLAVSDPRISYEAETE